LGFAFGFAFGFALAFVLVAFFFVAMSVIPFAVRFNKESIWTGKTALAYAKCPRM